MAVLLSAMSIIGVNLDAAAQTAQPVSQYFLGTGRSSFVGGTELQVSPCAVVALASDPPESLNVC